MQLNQDNHTVLQQPPIGSATPVTPGFASQITETVTPAGVTRRGIWMTPVGMARTYYEFSSHIRILGMPFVHIAWGRNPVTGKLAVARGFIAIGQFAIGVISIGQLSIGFLSLGQLSLGLWAALGQAAIGFLAIGQLAVGLRAAIGMLAVAFHAVGMLTAGGTCVGGPSACTHAWNMERRDPVAIQDFKDTPFRPMKTNSRRGSRH
ncbi:MAG: hypothetical protein ACKO14_10460 [Armatimonadota bacterium]